jgi:NADPH:quinone reductase-like Zn-dependent oxidoreductase
MAAQPSSTPAAAIQMRAARVASRGGAEGIIVERAPIPALASDDVLLRVHAAAITPSELGWVPTWTNPDGSDRTPTIPSHEVAGVVAAIGADVDGLSIGDRLFGLTDFYRDGAAAEYIAVRAGVLASWPPTIDAVAAAALPLSGLTAWQAVFDYGHLLARQRVLIHGAAGGIGTFAVQLAHMHGAHVTAVASAQDLDYARGLGADVVIDRRTEFVVIEPASIDLIVDTVGGDVLHRSWPLLAADGRLVSTAASSRGVVDRDRRGHFFIVTPDRGVLDELARLLESGELRVIVERTFSLGEAREAFEFAQREHPRGKVVLRAR